MQWPDGSSYKGGLYKGLKHGKGIYTFPTENEYEGDYRFGKKEGTGIFHWKKFGIKYTGEFSNDKMHGKGRLVHYLVDPELVTEGTWSDAKY